jgi:hypothetical protein
MYLPKSTSFSPTKTEIAIKLLNSDKNACSSSQTSCALPLNYFVLLEDECKPHANDYRLTSWQSTAGESTIWEEHLSFLHDAFVEVQCDGALLLDENYIMNIFSPLYDEIPPLKEFLDYHFVEKEGNVIGSCEKHEHVLAIDKAMAKLSFPQKIMENHQTIEFCKELVVGVATMLLMELTFPKKSVHNYINDGLLAFNNLTVAEKEVALGMRANNDQWEGNFATFTSVLCNSGQISIDTATGNIATISIAIMGVMSVVVESIGEPMSLQSRMVLSMHCQRS